MLSYFYELVFYYVLSGVCDKVFAMISHILFPLLIAIPIIHISTPSAGEINCFY